MKARDGLPNWQDNPTWEEIKLCDSLIVAYLSLGKDVDRREGESQFETRARLAVESADYALAIRRRLLGRVGKNIR